MDKKNNGVESPPTKKAKHQTFKEYLKEYKKPSKFLSKIKTYFIVERVCTYGVAGFELLKELLFS